MGALVSSELFATAGPRRSELMYPSTPDLSLADGLAASGLSHEELWLRQISVGGVAGRLETEAYVLGVLVPDLHQHNVIAHALNEHLRERGEPCSVGYRDTVKIR